MVTVLLQAKGSSDLWPWPGVCTGFWLQRPLSERQRSEGEESSCSILFWLWPTPSLMLPQSLMLSFGGWVGVGLIKRWADETGAVWLSECMCSCGVIWRAGQSPMGLVRITQWYPNFNGSHFVLPPSEIHRMTRNLPRLPPKIVWTATYSHRPHCLVGLASEITQRHMLYGCRVEMTLRSKLTVLLQVKLESSARVARAR